MTVEELKKAASSLRVLYVEDDAVLREQTEKFLGKVFGVVRSAADGQEGLDAYLENPFDIVVSDIRMPVMDGIDMIRKIREKSPRQVVMVISAYDFSDRMETFLEQKVERFLGKPVSSSELVQGLGDVVEEYLRRKEGGEGEEGLFFPEEMPESAVLKDKDARLLYHELRIMELEKRIAVLERKMELLEYGK